MTSFTRGLVIGGLLLILVEGVALDIIGMPGTLSLTQRFWLPIGSFNSCMSYLITFVGLGIFIFAEIKCRKKSK
jgi:hypothetical protein